MIQHKNTDIFSVPFVAPEWENTGTMKFTKLDYLFLLNNLISISLKHSPLLHQLS